MSKVIEAEVDPIKEATELLREENKKKQKAFIVDYKEVCKKHGMELQPTAGFNIVNSGNEK